MKDRVYHYCIFVHFFLFFKFSLIFFAHHIREIILRSEFTYVYSKLTQLTFWTVIVG